MAARRLHGFIYITIALCCVSIIVCCVSLATNGWFHAEGVGSNTTDLRIEVNYGLFKGYKIRSAVGTSRAELQLVCQGSRCMFSCGSNGSNRKQDLRNIIETGSGNDLQLCGNVGGLGTMDITEPRQSPESNDPRVFLNFGLYLMTILCLLISIIFSLISGGLALYNTYRTPIQPVLSVFGLYIWNGISALFVFLTMMFWGIGFSTGLKKNAAVSETLTGNFTTEGGGSLGVSFWILILAILSSLANIGIIRYRSWKIIKLEENNVKVMNEQLQTGDVLLF